MKFAAIALSVGVAGTLLVSNLQGATIVSGEGLSAEVLVDDMTTASIPAAVAAGEEAPTAIRLIDLRSGATCKMAHAGHAQPAFTPAPIGPDCSGSPELQKIVQWRSASDGSLVMADAQGLTVYRFVPGDGVLYESVYPATALVTIVPAKS